LIKEHRWWNPYRWAFPELEDWNQSMVL
jgi:hypothetical protein